jgi:hypothetical protein
VEKEADRLIGGSVQWPMCRQFHSLRRRSPECLLHQWQVNLRWFTLGLKWLTNDNPHSLCWETRVHNALFAFIAIAVLAHLKVSTSFSGRAIARQEPVVDNFPATFEVASIDWPLSE